MRSLRLLPFFFLFAYVTFPVFSQSFESYDEKKGNILFRDSEKSIRERYRYFYEQRAYPLGYIPEGAREEAWFQSKKMDVYYPRIPFSKSSATSSTTWTVVGPNNVGGRITGVCIHPTDPNVVYFTGADGGVWKSMNGGASFTPVSDDLPTMAMGSIDIDPSNPDIIYVGTGEANGSGDSYPGVGVVKSTDAGKTWFLNGGNFAANIGKIRIHLSRSNIVMAAARQGLFRSTDAGATWTKVRTGLAHDVVLHPTNHHVIFAGIQNAGIVKSNDSGATWTTLNIGFSDADSIGRLAIDICRTQPNIMYAVIVSGKGSSGLKAIVKTTDGGATWVRTNNASTPNFFSSQGWYNIDIAVDPVNPNRVLIGGVGHYLSTDGGYTWTSRSGLHVDQHAIEFSLSNPSIMYVGNDGGIYRSTDAGTTYTSLNGNLPITQFYELGIALQNPDMIIGGTQDNGSKHRKSASNNWSNATGGDGGYSIIDYSDANYVYTEYQNGSHMRSTNGGTNFQSINQGLYGSGIWVTPVAIHPTIPTILFTATTKKLYKTTNRGTLWFPFHGNMDSASSINYIAISPKNPDIMLVGYTNGKIWKSTNAGGVWTNISTGLPGRTCKDIIFDPVDLNTFYTCYSGYNSASVYKTTNGGTAWTNISGNLPAIPKNALEIDPFNPMSIFVGTDFGVYSTTNGGTTWDILGTGMPKVVIADLELHPMTGVLYAATHGRSVYALMVTTPVEFTSFAATRDGNNVSLTWRTASETNNFGFSVERMKGPRSGWEEIGFVEGKGSTNSVNIYSFIDEKIPDNVETLHYRLRQIDFDGTYEYSSEVSVVLSGTVPEDFVLEQNYPNPFNPITNIRYTLPAMTNVRLVVTDARGMEISELVNKIQYPGMHVVSFDASAIPSGAYFYHLVCNSKKLTKKMMVLK